MKRTEPMRSSTRSRAARLGGFVLAAALLSAGALPASAAPDDDLDQTIDPNQQQGTGQTVLSVGHVDVGPTFGTGQWALQVHDDTASPAVWRDPEDVVFQATDASILEVPDDDAFGFLELPAGADAYVLPQTEQPGIVWPGWNTQDPTLLDNLDLGTTFRLHAVEGPGNLVVYLQGGNFGAPQVLWSSHEPFPQDVWVEVNTHTHANWVFSQPGVYLVDAEFTGDLVTGETLNARDTLRFAVGDETDPADAFAATLTAPTDGDGQAADGDQDAGSDGDERSGTDADGDADDATVWYLVAAGAAILLVAVIVVVIVSARARRRGRAMASAASGTDSEDGS